MNTPIERLNVIVSTEVEEQIRNARFTRQPVPSPEFHTRRLTIKVADETIDLIDKFRKKTMINGPKLNRSRAVVELIHTHQAFK